MAQTSVEWLEEQFILLESIIGVHGIMYKLIDEAKEKEKEEAIRFANEWEARCNEGNMDSKEQLYEEMYNK